MQRVSFVVLLSLAAAPAWSRFVMHSATMNLDLFNQTTQTVNDFDLIVESPDYVPRDVFNEDLTGRVDIERRDFDGDGDVDTRIRWVFEPLAPGQVFHWGANMLGSEKVLDAYWTYNGQKVGNSLGVAYEETLIEIPGPGTGVVQVLMNLQAPGTFAGIASLENIRTFRDLPESLLDLADINRDLNLSSLSAWEVIPSQTSVVLPTDGSFSQISLGWTTSSGPLFESLIVGDIINNGNTAGRFWAINSQCPEPASLSLLALGALATLRRR